MRQRNFELMSLAYCLLRKVPPCRFYRPSDREHFYTQNLLKFVMTGHINKMYILCSISRPLYVEVHIDSIDYDYMHCIPPHIKQLNTLTNQPTNQRAKEGQKLARCTN